FTHNGQTWSRAFAPEMLLRLERETPFRTSCPDAHRRTRLPACEIGRSQHIGCRHHLQDIFVTGRLAYQPAATPSAFAVLRLINNSNFVGSTPGRLDGMYREGRARSSSDRRPRHN